MEQPESLAFVGIALSIFSAFLLSDLSTMAIAQAWSARSESPSLPEQLEMSKWYDGHLAWVNRIRALSPDGKYVKLTIRSRDWFPWVTTMGGCNIDDHLGFFALKSWKLWWHDRTLYNLLAHGIWSPHVFRLFDNERPSRRKVWDGARQAIETVNHEVSTKAHQRQRERAQEPA